MVEIIMEKLYNKIFCIQNSERMHLSKSKHKYVALYLCIRRGNTIVSREHYSAAALHQRMLSQLHHRMLLQKIEDFLASPECILNGPDGASAEQFIDDLTMKEMQNALERQNYEDNRRKHVSELEGIIYQYALPTAPEGSLTLNVHASRLLDLIDYPSSYDAFFGALDSVCRSSQPVSDILKSAIAADAITSVEFDRLSSELKKRKYENARMLDASSIKKSYRPLINYRRGVNFHI